MRRILLIVILLVIYGSLYPFDFHSRHLPASPLWILLHSWVPVLDRSTVVDIAINVLIYIPVGLFGSLALGPLRAILLAAALSAGIEMVQLFDRGRLCSTFDLVSNITGGAAGVWLARGYGKSMTRLLGKSRTLLRPSPALLLLCCWIAYQVFPLIPALRLYPLRVKITALLHPSSFSLLQMGTTTFEWLAVARLLEEIGFGAGALSLLMLIVPGRLLISARSFTWPELTGALAAWVVWNGWLAGEKRRSSLLAWLAVAVLLCRGLVPFHWQSQATPFSWMPFAGFLNGDASWSALVFFEKSFLYGTAVWLFFQSGYPLVIAGLGMAGLLAGIEFLQIHLKGRTPEITEPVYTLILAAFLHLLDSADRNKLAKH